MLTVSLILAGALAAQEPAKMPAGDGFVGRWNVKITDAEDTFASGGFQIAKKDGVLSGGVVWRSGSYLPAKSVEVKDGTLVLVREEKPGKPDTFEARLEGDTLKGKATQPTARSSTSRARGRRSSSRRRPRSGARPSRSSTARPSTAGSCGTRRRRTAGRS